MVFNPADDMAEDIRCGFDTIRATQIDTLGIDGVIKRLKDRVGNNPVYMYVVRISVDNNDGTNGQLARLTSTCWTRPSRRQQAQRNPAVGLQENCCL